MGDPPASFAPTVSLGSALFIIELGEDEAADVGLAIRGGVRHPFGDVTATLETWPNVNDFRITTILFEATYLLEPRKTLTRFLLLGVGHAWSSYHGPARSWTNANGTAASFGLGVEWSTGLPLDVRAEGLLRTDDGGGHAAIRVFMGWNQEVADVGPGATDRHFEAVVSWMTPVSGPWRFVEPGYRVRFSRLRGEFGWSLGFAVYHWQIPGEAFMRNYIWDTRAFIAQPALEYHPHGLPGFSVRGGPSIAMMAEGPGNGASFGGHAEAAWFPRWAAPFGVGLGWLWIRHDTVDPRITKADQHGLMLFGGLRL